MGYIDVELVGSFNGIKPLSITWTEEVIRLYLLTKILSLRDTHPRFSDLEIKEELAAAVMELKQTRHPSAVDKDRMINTLGVLLGVLICEGEMTQSELEKYLCLTQDFPYLAALLLQLLSYQKNEDD